MEAGRPVSRLWGHTFGIIQQTQIRLFDGFEAHGEGVVVPITDVAEYLERLFDAELIRWGAV